MSPPESPQARTPMSDEELRAVTLGEPTRLDRLIRLVDYDPEWPGLFRRETERIREALGDRALRVEHVGSTSVPGLEAKPTIDIVLIVADSSDESSYGPELAAAGYRLRIREPEWHEHRVFTGPDTDTNLHVFSVGCPELDRMLLFRDRLRTNESDLVRYGKAKRELAERQWRYVQNYADAKTAVIEAILDRTPEVTRESEV